MKIGVPRERKILEKRIALTPIGAKELTAGGHQVLIETAAGQGSGFSDQDYLSAGCKIANNLADVWQQSELIVKVKEPHQEEYQYFRPGLIIFDYLHLAGLPEVAKVLLQSGATALAYEMVQTEEGRLPLLEPMSEIAGKLSIINGANFLLSQNGGCGILLSSTNAGTAVEVTVLGFGIAGQAAASLASGMGAEITIVEKKAEKRELAREILGRTAKILDSSTENIYAACKSADLLVGAVLVPGTAAPRILTRDIISKMRKGSVFVDISIDQGGCSETSKVTSLAEPTYIDSGVIHYCVPNMPAQAPVTATRALTAATLPYIKILADSGLEKGLEKSAALRRSLSVHNAKITCPITAKALNF